MNSATKIFLTFVFFLLHHTMYFDFSQLRRPLNLGSRFPLYTNLCRKQNIHILIYKFFISRYHISFPRVEVIFSGPITSSFRKEKITERDSWGISYVNTMFFEHIYKKIYGMYSHSCIISWESTHEQKNEKKNAFAWSKLHVLFQYNLKTNTMRGES